MVFQEEQAASKFWPLRRWLSGKEDEEAGKAEDTDEDRWNRERGFDLADSMEKGLARELVTDFMQPLKRSSKLWRFHVVRSEDKLQYRLFSDDGDFLLCARLNLEARLVCFFLYNPAEREGAHFDPTRPAFTMAYNASKSEWRLTQERCEHCRFSPTHRSCTCHGKQQVAFIRHSRRTIGDGIFNCMDVHVPGLYSDGGHVIWCPLLGKGDLASPPEDSLEVQRLITRKPQWSNDVESLVLDFKGRHILSSAKNFQLALNQKPEHVICQFGKIGSATFSLDFRYPLSVIQAFSMAMTTIFWT
jgi:hypothetical protein